MIFFRLLAGIIVFAGYALYGDQKIRDEHYTKPLAKMPVYAFALYQQMLSAALTGASLSISEIKQVRLEILSMLSQGAVEQRNHEMRKVREQISPLGRLLSWFLKQKGLSYQQIEEKYAKAFSKDEQELHFKIIESASRSNPSVFGKLVSKLTGWFGGGSSSSAASSSSSSSSTPPPTQPIRANL